MEASEAASISQAARNAQAAQTTIPVEQFIVNLIKEQAQAGSNTLLYTIARGTYTLQDIQNALNDLENNHGFNTQAKKVDASFVIIKIDW